MAEQPLAASALRVFSSVDEVIDAVGDKLGPSPWMTIDQRAVDTFAEVTGDWQPLHCDPEVAAGSPYGGTIAHGYFTMSLVSSFARQLYRVDDLPTSSTTVLTVCGFLHRSRLAPESGQARR